jgi:hypothetical protein
MFRRHHAGRLPSATLVSLPFSCRTRRTAGKRLGGPATWHMAIIGGRRLKLPYGVVLDFLSQTASFSILRPHPNDKATAEARFVAYLIYCQSA